MGVGFFACDGCGEAICDCGDWVRCGKGCRRRYCDERCAARSGWREDEGSCDFCRGDDATDPQLLAFLLKQFFLTRGRALELYRKFGRPE